MMRKINTIKLIQRLPLYCGVQDSPYRNDGIPDYFPFALSLDEDNGLIVQSPSNEVESALNKLYQKHNLFLTVPIDESRFTKYQGDEFLHFLLDVANFDVKGKSILEIGCSTGYVLNELRLRGADVCGCEPGPSALTAVKRYGLKVKQVFFEPDLFEEKFDLVIHLNVLEHIINPVDFLKDITKVLKAGGFMFVGLPDCLRQLQLGDPGMILHEHWGYFTLRSLQMALGKAGLTSVKCIMGEYDDLYGWGQWQDIEAKNMVAYAAEEELKLAQEFSLKLDNVIKIMQIWIDNARDKNLHIALYGASVGLVNLWALLDWHNVEVAIYDSDPAKHGKYLPGCPLPIQAPAELFRNMPDTIMVLPVIFTQTITNYLRQDLKIPDSVRIDTLSDLAESKYGQ